MNWYITKHDRWGCHVYAGPLSLGEAQRLLDELSQDKDAVYTLSN